jgi:hypothetical protein
MNRIDAVMVSSLSAIGMAGGFLSSNPTVKRAEASCFSDNSTMGSCSYCSGGPCTDCYAPGHTLRCAGYGWHCGVPWYCDGPAATNSSGSGGGY